MTHTFTNDELAAHDREVAAKALEDAVPRSDVYDEDQMRAYVEAHMQPIIAAAVAKERERCARLALAVGDEFSDMTEGAHVAAARIMGDQENGWDSLTAEVEARIREGDTK